MTSHYNCNGSDIFSQIIALNKSIIKLNIERLEDEILAFEDSLRDAMAHPEKAASFPFTTVKEKFAQIKELENKLTELE